MWEMSSLISVQTKDPSLLLKKLATKIENLWQNPRSKMTENLPIQRIYPKKYTYLAILENVMVPTMPKPIMKMNVFRDFIAFREKKLYNVQ